MRKVFTRSWEEGRWKLWGDGLAGAGHGVGAAVMGPYTRIRRTDYHEV